VSALQTFSQDLSGGNGASCFGKDIVALALGNQTATPERASGLSEFSTLLSLMRFVVSEVAVSVLQHRGLTGETRDVLSFTLRRGFPKGRKQLHIIAVDGIPRGEEITVTEASDSVLILPKSERALHMFGQPGIECPCKRCQRGNEEEDQRIQATLHRLHATLAVRPPTDESTKEAMQCLKDLDKLLPFSMVVKAKAKVLLASAFSELSQRAAWQEESRGANVIQWTGLDATAQEQRLKDTKKLYETAAKDFEYLLGQEALAVLERIEVGYGPVHDQHKMLSKYAREREQREQQPPRESAAPPRVD